MEKYTNILKEIQNTKNAMRDTARAEKEMERAYFREAAHNGTPEEIEKARADYHAAIERYNAETIHNETQKMKIQILTDNAKQAFFAENIGAICETWNKYAGKSHGPKTAEKIKNELQATVNAYVSIGNRFRDARIYIIPNSDNEKKCFYDIEFCPMWTGSDYPALIDNKIQKLDPARFRVLYCSEYVENVNEHVEKIRKAYAAAKEAEKAFSEAVSAYNKLTRGNMERADTRNGVKTWIIN